jgi:hypothetical protein
MRSASSRRCREEYDMDLSEFREELENRCSNSSTRVMPARNVLDAPTEDLLQIEGLTEDKVGR